MMLVDLVCVCVWHLSLGVIEVRGYGDNSVLQRVTQVAL